MTVSEAIIIAIVEGITEFIPISSTGHMIITGKLLNTAQDDFAKMFTVAIQLGAILAVVVLYFKKFFMPQHGWAKQWSFYLKLIVGVIPALLLGYLFAEKIDSMLESATTVAISLLAGGVVLIFIDRFFRHGTCDDATQTSYKQSFLIGLFQCLAMIPGVSRSAASIIGGMQQKLTRNAAAEFSFFLAVPTMFAATGYKLLEHYQDKGGFTGEEIKLLTIGNLVAFVIAMLAIRFFITFLKKYGFRFWGFYRIIVGIALLVMIYTGYLDA